MAHRLRRLLARLRGRAPAEREVTVFGDDVFLVSYPRSGNTWVRFLLGNLQQPSPPVTFANLEQRVPDIYVNPDRMLRTRPRPRVLKSHEPFDGRYRRVIYLVRDPRDVAVSYYHYLRKVRVLPLAEPLEGFVERRFLSRDFERIGTWGDHLAGWLAARESDRRFLLLRYEELLAEPAVGLRRIAAHLDWQADEGVLARAVEQSSLDSMQRSEQRDGDAWKALAGSREEIKFIRQGRSGSWRDELPAASAARIAAAWPALLERFGYADA